jgi:hypothetical protein
MRTWVLPHAHVHGGRNEEGTTECESRLGENVVRQTVRELRQGVRRERRDHEQVRLDEVRIEVVSSLPPRQRFEGVRGDEALRIRRQDWSHLVAGLDEEAHELTGLIGRDAARHANENASHLGSFRR